MMNTYKTSFLILVCFVLFSTGTTVLAYQNPIANAGPDLYLSSGQIVDLQGSGYDPNGFSVNYYWTCNGGTLSSYNIAQPIYFAPSINNYNEQTIYTCTLTVSNNYGGSNSDSSMIFMKGNNNSNYYGSNYVQTNPATNMFNGQATLNGNISASSNTPGTVYAWFQWGTSTSYNYESNHRAIGYTGPFDQHIADLLPNTIYHFRVVAQKNNGELVYGQDMTFNSAGYIPQILGASTVSTGLTNNFLKDSFFLPLLLLLLSAWLYFSGKINIFADKLKAKCKKQ